MGEPAVEKSLIKIIRSWDCWLVVIIVCFILLAFVSWGKLMHPIFDTGNEIEVTSRLLEGELLYRDLQSNYTPLPYYVNALILGLLGHHLEVFYTVGLVLALVAVLLVYGLAKQLTNGHWAALCTLYILIYCSFNPGGLWNFITPYSYGSVYATVFCLLAFTAIERYGHTANTRWLVAAAIASGFAGLGKQEFGVAAVAGVLVGINLCFSQNFLARVKGSLIVILVACTCVFIPLFLIAKQVSWETLQMSLLPISKSQILTESGLFDVSLIKTVRIWNDTFKIFIGTSLVVGAAIASADWLKRREWICGNYRFGILVELLVSIVFTLVGLGSLQIIVWQKAFKVLLLIVLLLWILAIASRWFLKPQWITNSRWLLLSIRLFAGVTFLGLCWFTLRRFVCCSNVVFHPLGNLAWLIPLLVGWFAFKWRQLIQHPHAPLLWTLLVFSVVLNSRFLFHISFYALYAVTAVLLFFTLLYHLALQSHLPIWRFLLICLLIGGGMNLFTLGQYRYAVNSERGTFYTQDEDLAIAFNETISYINGSGAKSVLVLPAGATLNFLTGTHSPSQETIFLPGIIPTANAEREFIVRMHNNPPELIVYVDIPFWWLKPGYQTYAEYNPLIYQWIAQEHKQVYLSPKLAALGQGKEWKIGIYIPKKHGE